MMRDDRKVSPVVDQQGQGRSWRPARAASGGVDGLIDRSRTVRTNHPPDSGGRSLRLLPRQFNRRTSRYRTAGSPVRTTSESTILPLPVCSYIKAIRRSNGLVLGISVVISASGLEVSADGDRIFKSCMYLRV